MGGCCWVWWVNVVEYYGWVLWGLMGGWGLVDGFYKLWWVSKGVL